MIRLLNSQFCRCISLLLVRPGVAWRHAELEAMLERAGFLEVQTSVVHKEPETPFQTLLAVANKPA